MENIIYENINEIGDYNKIEDSYYDLSSYIISPLERIILYLNEEKTFINGIELFYSSQSTGIFSSPKEPINDNNKIDIICNNEEEKILNIKGCFIKNRIIKLVFINKKGEENGFNNEKDYQNFKNKKYFQTNSTNELIGMKIAFNHKLTYFEPIFKKEEELTVNEELKIIKSNLFGRKFDDSKEFILDKKVYSENWILTKLNIIHDNHLIMGIQMFYTLNNDNFSVNFGQISNGLIETIELNLKNNEEISIINIRSGAMIDAIYLFTNNNNILISGGNGGGQHKFILDDIKNKFKDKNNIKLIGFEGSYSGVLHQLNVLFKYN